MPNEPLADILQDNLVVQIVVKLMIAAIINTQSLVRAAHLFIKFAASFRQIETVGPSMDEQRRSLQFRASFLHARDGSKRLRSKTRGCITADKRIGFISGDDSGITRERALIQVQWQAEGGPDLRQQAGCGYQIRLCH